MRRTLGLALMLSGSIAIAQSSHSDTRSSKCRGPIVRVGVAMLHCRICVSL